MAGCIEVHSANETCTYLMKLIHEVGLELRSSAVCTGLRRIRYGHFTLTHALLTKHCDARSLAENIDYCRPAVNQTYRSDIIRGTQDTHDVKKVSRQPQRANDDADGCDRLSGNS